MPASRALPSVRLAHRRSAAQVVRLEKEGCDATHDSLAAVTRYFAAYNLVCGPVVDDENHLVGAVSVDDVLDHLLPDDWREREEPELSGAEGAT